MIPLHKCKDGYLYEIDARNGDLGVYSKKKKGFYLIRTKFQLTFLDLEIHWDADDHYGTAQPLKIIKKCPHKDEKGIELWLREEINCLKN